jgi:hypothetical protein
MTLSNKQIQTGKKFGRQEHVANVVSMVVQGVGWLVYAEVHVGIVVKWIAQEETQANQRSLAHLVGSKKVVSLC